MVVCVVALLVFSSVAAAQAATSAPTLSYSKLPSNRPQSDLIRVVGQHFTPNAQVLLTAVNGTQFKFVSRPKTSAGGTFSVNLYIPKVFTGAITVTAKTGSLVGRLQIRPGAGAASAGKVTTSSGAVSRTVATPVRVHAFTGGADIAVLWDDPNTTKAAKYNVYRNGKLVATPTKIPLANPADAKYELEYDGTRYYDKNVVAGTTYKYSVSAVGADGSHSALSAPIAVTQPTKTTPVPKIVIDASAAPELEARVKALSENVKTWYPKISDVLAYPDYTPAPTITIRLENTGQYGALTDPNSATIKLDAGALRKDPDEAGVLVHECTHIIEDYDEENPPPAFLTEGVADWARIYLFHGKDARLYPDQTYEQGYDSGAGLMQWIVRTYKGGNLVRQANIAGHNGTYDDSIFTDKAGGKSLDDLWKQYSTSKAVPRS